MKNNSTSFYTAVLNTSAEVGQFETILDGVTYYKINNGKFKQDLKGSATM
jgi:hypothetical protein